MLVAGRHASIPLASFPCMMLGRAHYYADSQHRVSHARVAGSHGGVFPLDTRTHPHLGPTSLASYSSFPFPVKVKWSPPFFSVRVCVRAALAAAAAAAGGRSKNIGHHLGPPPPPFVLTHTPKRKEKKGVRSNGGKGGRQAGAGK